MAIPADEAMKKAVQAAFDAVDSGQYVAALTEMSDDGRANMDGDIDFSEIVKAVIRALDAAGYEVRAKGVTNEMISAAATSRATDDEGEFPLLLDLINFSGENKTRTVIRAALESALAAAPKLTEVKP